MDYDLVVIGGGAGGLAASRAGHRAGARTLLVNDGPLGGDCTFTGCVPSKTLLAAAARGDGFGSAMATVADTVASIAATETAEVLRGEGIDVAEARARFVGPRTIDVDGTTHAARRVVVATGAGPAVPPIPGLREIDHLTNETVFAMTSPPPMLAVLGGGPIGCELAQAFARLGSRVVVFEALDRILPRDEAEASVVVAAALARDGIEILTGDKVTQVDATGPGAPACIHTESGRRVDVDRILVAVGRRPNTEGLDPEAGGVDLDERGFVVTDDRLRTSAAGVYGVGDVTGRLQFTHAADQMGRIAVANGLSTWRRVMPMRFDPTMVPWVTFTDPEVAHVGLTEDEAVELHPAARVAELPMTEVDRAVTTGRTEGFVKLIAGPRRVIGDLAGGRVLGATIVGPTAGELIHEVALARRVGAFTGRLAQTVHAYPTWSTAVAKAAAQFFFEFEGRTARPVGHRD